MQSPPSLRARAAVVAAMAAVLVIPAAAQAPPAFVAGDPARLKCRILKSEEAARKSNVFILTVEVSSPGPATAEPLDFEITGPKLTKPVTLTRVTRPLADRAGRAVPPGGKKPYWLQIVRLAGEMESLAARVTDASFFTGTGVEAAPVKTGAIRHETATDAGGPPNVVSFIDVENRLAERVDAVVQLECDEPVRGRSLARLRLEASEKRSWRVAASFGTIAPVDSGGSVGAKVTAAKVIDWSVERAPADGREPLADFADAWRGWLRRPEDAPPVEGRFVLEESSVQPGAPAGSARASGTFRIDARTPVRFTPDAAIDAAGTRGVESAFVKAFAPVFRRSAEDVVRDGTVVRECRGIYRVAPGVEGDSRFPRMFTVRDRRFAGWTDCESGGITDQWTTTPLGDGFVVTKTALFQTALGRDATESETFEYDLWNGLVVPTLHRWTWELKPRGSATHTTLRVLPAAGAAANVAAPATLQVPEAIRKAWDAAYTYPLRKVTLTGAFTVESPGTDALWQGFRKLRGTFHLTGFRGMIAATERWEGAAFDLDLRASEETKQQLAGVVEDRLRMCAFRDFAGREPFERLFGSADFEPVPGNAGAWTIKNGGWDSLEIRNGVIAAYGPGRDVRRTVEYARAGGALVPVRICTGDEELLATFVDLGGGWIVPATLEFRRVFGRDWGPEKLAFTNLRITE